MQKDVEKKKGTLDRWMDFIERVGNALPDPVSLFIILAVIVVVLSAIFGSMGMSAVHPGTGKTITVVNLLTKDGFRQMYSKAVNNFASFAPLGMVLVCVIGAAAAEKSGFLVALMQRVMRGAKSWVVTFAILFVGINANVAGDAGFIVMPPLAAVIYMGIGRSPVLGMFVAFAGVAGGFCANMILGMSDALAYGFTEAAAKMIDPSYQQSMAVNWYFLIVSCITLTIGGTLLVEKFLVHRFPCTKEDLAKFDFDESSADLKPEQIRGLKWGLTALAVYLVVLLGMCVGADPLLADPQSHSIMSPKAPFMSGIILTVAFALLVVGAGYGFGSGKYKNDKDLFADIILGFKDMSSYILLCFFIAQFTSYFAWSNLGMVMAIKGAEVLKELNFTGAPLLIGLVFVSCIINLFIGSASAKWAILAPIFVPMLMIMGYDPAVAQVAYRIGDSITNPLSPLFYYTPVILGYLRRYAPEAGLGTVIANMIPYSVTFTVIWIIQLLVWLFLDLPLGPGGGIFLK